jgi:polyisoprenoid-binding protein YceI
MLCVLAAPITAAFASPEVYGIDSDHTFVTWSVRHLGISTQRGRFNRSAGKVVLDREAHSGRVDVTIDAASIDIGSATLERVLRGSSFFDVERFPTVVFRSTAITFDGEQPTVIDGELTLLGVTRPVKLSVSGFACTRFPFIVTLRCGIDATTTLRRSEFGMTSFLGFVGDEVTLMIQAEGTRIERAVPVD